MEFKHTLVDSQEARAIASSLPTDATVRFLIIDDINDAVTAGLFTATVSVASASVLIRLKLEDELIQLGYAVNGTTTPDSFIITW